MGEIVWAKTHERRDHLEDHVYGEVPADARITVFASKDKVCMVDSTMVVGANRNSGKKYYQWRTVSSVGFFRNKAGHLQPYHANRPLRQKVWSAAYPQTAFYYLEEDDKLAGESMQAYREACKRYLHIKSVYDLYPMAEVMGLPERFTLLPANLRPHMRTTDWTEFMSGAVGKSRVTPGMIKSAQNSEPFLISLANEFRGLVPDGTLAKFLANAEFDEKMMEQFQPYTPNVRPVVRLLDERSRRRLLGAPIIPVNVSAIRYVTNRVNAKHKLKTRYAGPLGSVADWQGLTSLA